LSLVSIVLKCNLLKRKCLVSLLGSYKLLKMSWLKGMFYISKKQCGMIIQGQILSKTSTCFQGSITFYRKWESIELFNLKGVLLFTAGRYILTNTYSAGCGRTGTLIALYVLIDSIEY
jgi:hypothetical protein